MKIYISGPMTGIENFNFPLFNQVAEELTALGHVVSNPAEKGEVKGWSWEDYLKYDLHEVLDQDALVMLPDWEKSKGARLEKFVADMLKIPTPTLAEFKANPNLVNDILLDRELASV